MTRPGASRAKAKKNDEQVAVKRRGAKCHFVGEQWDFLCTEAPQFHMAVDNGTQGLFYKMMGRRFIRKWGWNNVQVPAGEDDDEADDDPNAAADNAKIAAADNANIVEDNSIDPALRGTTSEAVANESSEEFNAFARKLGQFYRYHFGRPAVPTKAAVNPFAALLGRETVPAPRHSSAFDMYRKLYCPEHVAPFFAARFKIEEDRYAALSEDERAQTKKPSGIGFRTKMYHEYFKQESREDRERYQALADREYEDAMAKHRALAAGEKSPKELYLQMLYVARYLQPWIDTISQEMQACVSLLIMLPVSNGEVELRSLHANTPTGIPGMTWPVVDPLGFEEAQQSVLRYARTVFPPEERKRRMYEPTAPPTTEQQLNLDSLIPYAPSSGTPAPSRAPSSGPAPPSRTSSSGPAAPSRTAPSGAAAPSRAAPSGTAAPSRAASPGAAAPSRAASPGTAAPSRAASPWPLLRAESLAPWSPSRAESLAPWSPSRAEPLGPHSPTRAASQPPVDIPVEQEEEVPPQASSWLARRPRPPTGPSWVAKAAQRILDTHAAGDGILDTHAAEDADVTNMPGGQEGDLETPLTRVCPDPPQHPPPSAAAARLAAAANAAATVQTEEKDRPKPRGGKRGGGKKAGSGDVETEAIREDGVPEAKETKAKKKKSAPAPRDPSARARNPSAKLVASAANAEPSADTQAPGKTKTRKRKQNTQGGSDNAAKRGRRQ